LLKDRIAERGDVRIGVIGLGYVGLPLAVEFTKHFNVIGIDIEAAVISQLSQGVSSIEGLPDDRIRTAIEKGRLTLEVIDKEPAKTEESAIQKLFGIDVFVICVPTPLKADNGWAPDLKYIEKAQQLIERVCEGETRLKQLPAERLIVLESTSYPGTTKEIFEPLINRQQDSGSQWYLAYSPERTNPGPKAYNRRETVKRGEERGAFQITRVVGGLNPESAEVAQALYKTIHDAVHPVSSLEAAEMVKLVENTFRFVAIGFSNELSRIARTFGLNVWEIIQAAKSKDFGLDMCEPGLIGGHCLPIDPHYLGWALRKQRKIAHFIDVAEKAHEEMRLDAHDLIQRLLNRNERGFAGSNILFLGISYKKNVGDIRESAALGIIKKLHMSNAKVSFWDPVRARHSIRQKPHIRFSKSDCLALSETGLSELQTDGKGNHFLEPAELKGTWAELRERVLGNEFHCIVLATNHDDFKACYEDLISATDGPPVADLANCLHSWLEPLADNKTRRRIEDARKYMLLGVD
jgi:UDP-N-acetyl-D-glucosamine dehydrogenase